MHPKFLLLIVFSCSAVAEENDEWVDPWAPPGMKTAIPGFDVSKGNCKKESCLVEKGDKKNRVRDEKDEKTTSSQKRPDDYLFLRRFVNVWLHSLGDVDIEREAEIISTGIVSKVDLDTLRHFSKKKEIADVSDVAHVMEKIFSKVHVKRDDDMDYETKDWTSLVIGGLILISGCLVALLIYLALKIHLSWIKIITCLLVILWLVSSAWEWRNLYEESMAKKAAEQMKEMPPECKPQTGIWGTGYWFKAWVRETFSTGEDPCVKYHKAFLVNPASEAVPMKAAARAFIHLFIEPMKMIFEAFGESFSLLMRHLPIQWQPFVFVVFSVLFLIFLIMISGYSIQIPLLFKFAPRDHAPASIKSEQIKALMNEIESMKELMNTYNNSLNQMQAITQGPRDPTPPTGNQTPDEKHPVQETKPDSGKTPDTVGPTGLKMD